MSDTPRTDARLMVVTDNDTCKIKVLETVHASFVRILEREVNALTAECDQLRARAERAEADLAALEQSFDDNCRGVVKIADDLATERARLDSGQILLTVSGERVWHCGVDLRAAIDAGMREGAK